MTFFIATMVLKGLAGPVLGEVWTIGRYLMEVSRSRKLAVLVVEGHDVRQMMH